MIKIDALRALMAREKIDTYIVTKLDPHQSEIASEYWNSVEALSGFTGSNGTMVITADYAGLWTDGRYYIQAEREIAGSGVELQRASEVGVKDYLTFAAEHTSAGGVIGFDGRTISFGEAKKLLRRTTPKKIRLKTDPDLVGAVWPERPALPKQTVLDHPIRFCGLSRWDKINNLRLRLSENSCDVYVLSQLDDIAWLLNLRGVDSGTELIFNAYAVIEKDRVVLFTDSEIKADGFCVKQYNEVEAYLADLAPGTAVLLNPDRTCYALYQILKDHPLIKISTDITTEMKAVKNGTELAGFEAANIRDGAAMVRFLIWLNKNLGRITECGAAEKLRALRSQGEHYIGPAFDTIAGYMANAAMMHYNAKEGDCAVIQPEGFLLVDSGAHYWDGTTDITRTVVVGPVTQEMKRDFTLVLKSHIALARAVFLYGATGSNLDVLARMPMWINGMDYKSGTGHGVGFCLCVHEGPQRISQKPNEYQLEPGMIVTNEPGVYKEGKYGIRTENMMVVEEQCRTECGRFLKFKIIAYCPIDLEGIDVSMLDADEKKWLNDYHALVREKLAPALSQDERAWLADATRSL